MEPSRQVEETVKRKMEKGLSKDWTPEEEALYQSWLASCHTFAERDLMMTLRDHLKYEGKRARAWGQTKYHFRQRRIMKPLATAHGCVGYCLFGVSQIHTALDFTLP